MSKRNLSSVVVAVVMFFSVTAVFGQSQDVRVALKGTAYMVGNANGLGLEVGGKLVVPKTYSDFKTDDGKFFAVQGKDNKWGVCNAQGKFIYQCIYYKTYVSVGTIQIQEKQGGTSKFYNTATPTTEVKVTKLDPLAFDPATKKSHERAIEAAQEIAEQDSFTEFEFRENERGRLELWINGTFDLYEYKTTADTSGTVQKITGGTKLFEAKDMYIASNYDSYKKTGNWYIVVEDRINSRDVKGLFLFNITNRAGNKYVSTVLCLPIQYQYVRFCDNVVICTEFSGAEKYFNKAGRPVAATECKTTPKPDGKGTFVCEDKPAKPIEVGAAHIIKNNPGESKILFGEGANWTSMDVVLIFSVPEGQEEAPPAGEYQAKGIAKGACPGSFQEGKVIIEVVGKEYTVKCDLKRLADSWNKANRLTGTYIGKLKK
jgi:hypothetical protein